MLMSGDIYKNGKLKMASIPFHSLTPRAKFSLAKKGNENSQRSISHSHEGIVLPLPSPPAMLAVEKKEGRGGEEA